MIQKLREKLSRFLFRDEGGKKVLNRKNSTLVAVLLSLVGLTISLLPTIFSSGHEASQIRKSDLPLTGSQVEKPNPVSNQSGPSIGGIADHAPKNSASSGIRTQARSTIRYRAKQVLGPEGGGEQIPRGANFVGKLLTAIDTRAPTSIQVTLPYGGSHKSGTGTLPKDTVLFGQASYSGQGERVYVNFDHGLLPDGTEVSIQGRALSSKDYTAGIEGDFHSNTGNRIASVLGLSMIGGMSEVMVEKEALGQTFEATPKASLKNGFYNGLSKVTQTEAGIQAEKLNQTPEYVTIDAGTDLIVTLTSSYGQGERR